MEHFDDKPKKSVPDYMGVQPKSKSNLADD
jgi:hypothetical protein